jgi:hypothetical protein
LQRNAGRHDPLDAGWQRFRITEPEWNHETGIPRGIYEIDDLIRYRRQWAGARQAWRASLEQVELNLKDYPTSDDDQSENSRRRDVD